MDILAIFKPLISLLWSVNWLLWFTLNVTTVCPWAHASYTCKRYYCSSYVLWKQYVDCTPAQLSVVLLLQWSTCTSLCTLPCHRMCPCCEGPMSLPLVYLESVLSLCVCVACVRVCMHTFHSTTCISWTQLRCMYHIRVCVYFWTLKYLYPYGM